jgi:hypothetical protein
MRSNHFHTKVDFCNTHFHIKDNIITTLHGRYDQYDKKKQKIGFIRLTIKELYEYHLACTVFQNSEFPDFQQALTNLYNDYHADTNPLDMQNLKQAIGNLLTKWMQIPKEIREQNALPGRKYNSGRANMVHVKSRMTILDFIKDNWLTVEQEDKRWILQNRTLIRISNLHRIDVGNTHLDILDLLGRLQTFI